MMDHNHNLSAEDMTEMLLKNQMLSRRIKEMDKLMNDAGASQDQAEKELEIANDEHKKIVTRLESKIVSLGNQNVDLENELRLQQSSNQDLEKKNQELKVKIRDFETPVSANQLEQSSIFDLENQITALKTLISSKDEEHRKAIEDLCKKDEKIAFLENNLSDDITEIENLTGIADCLRNECQELKDRNLELEAIVHSAATQCSIAPQGNSLFAEAIDGKAKLEGELEKIFKEKETYKNQLSKLLKMISKHSVAKNSGVNSGELLCGPTLNSYNILRNELNICLNEKKVLLDKVHELEQAARKQSQENQDDYSHYQELRNEENLKARKRSDQRVMQLEMEMRYILDALGYEKERAKKYSLFEATIENYKQLVAHYEEVILRGGNIDNKNDNNKNK